MQSTESFFNELSHFYMKQQPRDEKSVKWSNVHSDVKQQQHWLHIKSQLTIFISSLFFRNCKCILKRQISIKDSQWSIIYIYRTLLWRAYMLISQASSLHQIKIKIKGRGGLTASHKLLDWYLVRLCTSTLY